MFMGIGMYDLMEEFPTLRDEVITWSDRFEEHMGMKHKKCSDLCLVFPHQCELGENRYTEIDPSYLELQRKHILEYLVFYQNLPPIIKEAKDGKYVLGPASYTTYNNKVVYSPLHLLKDIDQIYNLSFFFKNLEDQEAIDLVRQRGPGGYLVKDLGYQTYDDKILTLVHHYKGEVRKCRILIAINEKANGPFYWNTHPVDLKRFVRSHFKATCDYKLGCLTKPVYRTQAFTLLDLAKTKVVSLIKFKAIRYLDIPIPLQILLTEYSMPFAPQTIEEGAYYACGHLIPTGIWRTPEIRELVVEIDNSESEDSESIPELEPVPDGAYAPIGDYNS